MNYKTSIFLADDHTLVRSGMKLLIDTQRDMTVVGECGNYVELHSELARTRPDVLLLDLSMPGGEPSAAIRRIRLDFPRTRIVVVSMHDDSVTVKRMLKSGAHAFVLKSHADAELLSTIRSVLQSEGAIQPNLAEGHEDTQATANDELANPLRLLSTRERQVLELLIRGHTNQQIADKLQVGIKSIESYRARTMVKLGVQSRPEMITKCIELGLLS